MYDTDIDLSYLNPPKDVYNIKHTGINWKYRSIHKERRKSER